MELTKIATEEVNGIAYGILVDGNGTFYAEVDGTMMQAATKAQLVDKLKLLKRLKPVAVSATLVYSDQLIPITLTGIHAANKNVIYRIDGKPGAQQLSGYSRDEVLRAITADEQSEYASLQKAEKAAHEAVTKWLKARVVSPKKLIEEARAVDAIDPAATKQA